MPKYYCDYCKSYLTHDKMSVRKSHLAGKNHIRFYCDYYEEKAKQLGLWDPNDIKYQVTLDYLDSHLPSPRRFAQQKLRDAEKSTVRRTDSEEDLCLPPPPTLSSMPPPPPSVLCKTDELVHLVSVHTARQDRNL